MAAPGSLTLTRLIALTKQALGGRDTGLMDDPWYTERINSAYARLCTFQGQVLSPGMRQPQFRVIRFFELYRDDDRTIASSGTTNFITPTTSEEVVYVDSVYDLTNDRPLKVRASRWMKDRNPDSLGIPRQWVPGGRQGVTGYYVFPRPSTSSDEISVRETTYVYPDELSGAEVPVIPKAWHAAIWPAAAAEAALLIDWPEKESEMEARFMKFLAERRSPVEESGAAGGRRHFTVGGRDLPVRTM